MRARLAAVFYVLVFVMGGLSMSASGSFAKTGAILAHETAFRLGWIFGVLSTVCYIVVTALFYDLFKPVNKSLSLTAAFFSLMGCGIGSMSFICQIAAQLVLKDAHYSSTFSGDQARATAFALLRLGIQVSNVGLVFFGFYCLSIGILIFGSNFLPRILGAGMVFAGLGWLTFLWPPLASSLAPYNFLPGMLGEASLTLWLLVMGVNADRWKQQLVAVPENS